MEHSLIKNISSPSGDRLLREIKLVINCRKSLSLPDVLRGGSGTAATSKIEHFVIIVNGWKPLAIIKKYSILDVAAVLDPPLVLKYFEIA